MENLDKLRDCAYITKTRYNDIDYFIDYIKNIEDFQEFIEKSKNFDQINRKNCLNYYVAKDLENIFNNMKNYEKILLKIKNPIDFAQDYLSKKYGIEIEVEVVEDFPPPYNELRSDVMAIAPDLYDNKEYKIPLKILVRRNYINWPIGVLFTIFHEFCHHITGKSILCSTMPGYFEEGFADFLHFMSYAK